jgi:pimeloyl-ACP methyl ester carboxylesterase
LSNPHIHILHGWAIDQFNDSKWQPLIKALKQAGITTTFLKLPGLSSPLDEVWELDDYIKWLDKELPKNKQVILLGHSFGGQIAIRYTSLNLEKVAKLILIDSAGIIDKRPKKVIKRKIFWLLAKLGKKVLFPLDKRGRPKAGGFFRNLLYKLAREGDYKNAPPLMRKVMQNVINQEVTQEAATITCPTLIIWGQNDQATPLYMGEKYHQLIKQSQLKIVNGARHAPQFTHIDQTVQLIKEFLKTVSS